MNIKSKTLDTREDVQFLQIILDELHKQAENGGLSTFSYNKTLDYDGVDIDGDYPDDDFKREESLKPKIHRNLMLEIRWSPCNDKHHPLTHIEMVLMRWKPTTDWVYVDMRYSSSQGSKTTPTTSPYSLKNNNTIVNANYSLGKSHSDMLKFKVSFIKLYKAIEKYQVERLPIVHREQLQEAFYDMFPHQLDKVLMEGSGADEKA